MYKSIKKLCIQSLNLIFVFIPNIFMRIDQKKESIGDLNSLSTTYFHNIMFMFEPKFSINENNGSK